METSTDGNFDVATTTPNSNGNDQHSAFKKYFGKVSLLGNQQGDSELAQLNRNESPALTHRTSIEVVASGAR
jgi:hypothetical protein